jgi:uncharacterized protein (TIGR02217 family)
MPLLQSFHETRFPTGIALASSGGPERRTEIVTLGSGHEQRNARWQDSRRRYDAGYGVKNLDDLYAIIAFFEERRGALYGFRFKDPLDWKSCPPLQVSTETDQEIGTGDGSTDLFQLSKTYGVDTAAYIRAIIKPVEGSLMLAVDGTPQVAGTDFTIDYSNGEVTFQPGHIPVLDAVITAGYQFDVPVRFANDDLTINLAAFEAGSIPSIPLLEVKI